MKLVEIHLIKRKHRLFKALDQVCFKAKNLHNAALYNVRQHFFQTGTLLDYYQLQKDFQNSRQPDYIALPTKVSQQILMLVCRNFKSFLHACQAYSEHPEKFQAPPRIPGYKHKTQGRYVAIYTIQSISKPMLRQGQISLSQSEIKFCTHQHKIQQVRLIPRRNHYKIEVVYLTEPQSCILDKSKVAGVDIGLDNLAAVTSNQANFQPLLINGRPLKAINHYFNRRRSQLMSQLKTADFSHQLERLTHKRNCKINNYLHHASRYLIDILLVQNIGTLVIGKNDLWKQNIELGKRNNQNFVGIPHARFISQLQYKAQLVGINVIITEESYTSKCSFLDLEQIGKHKVYCGQRIARGLFQAANGRKINADINASANIIRKAIPNAFANGIQGIVVFPKRVTPFKTKIAI